MDGQILTQILSIALIISIIILFILIVAFIIIALKNQKEKKEREAKFKKENSTPTEENGINNGVQTKTYTIEDVKKFLDFDDIKDNMIIQLGGKKLIMVIQCQGINYDLMSGIEKASVEQGFVQFLNTLTRPIQIYVQSRKVNLEESIINYKKRLKNIEQNYNKARIQFEQAQSNPAINTENFKKIRMEYIKQKNLLEYTKDIIANTERMSLNKNILTKNYYIAISYYPEDTEGLFKKEELLDMAFSELYTTAQSILRTLSICNITGKVLDSTELADLLYVAYNRDASEIYGIDKAIKSGYDALYTTAPDVINKKIEELDKMIYNRAVELANNTIEDTILKDRRQKELEDKERDLEKIIRQMAKNMIDDNKDYIGEEVAEKSKKEIDKIEENEKKLKVSRRGRK